MFAVLYLLSFFESIADGPDCDAIVVVVKVTDYDLASSLVWVVLLGSSPIFVALHCEGLAAASLPIGEYGCMKAIDYLLDQCRYLQALEHVFLRMVTVEYLIESVVFLGVIISLVESDLVLICIHLQELLCMASLDLMRKQWPHTDCHSNI